MLRSLQVLGAAVVVAACVLLPGRAADPADPAPVKLAEAEQKMFDLTNEARAREKLPPLKLNAKLTEAARAHSANMARQEKMEHVLDGKNPADRIKAAGYRFRAAAENIAWTNGNPPEKVFQGWMESKLHRENILNPEYTEIGIGMARNDKGDIYYTQDFGRPKSPAP